MDNFDNGGIVDLSDSGLEYNSSDPGEDEDEELSGDSVVREEDELQSPSMMNEAEPGDLRFDAQLASLHSYLGPELEVVRGRTVLEDGAIVTMNMLQPADLVLMPGQTLPLAVFDHPTINMLRTCLRSDRTFGVLASWTDRHSTTLTNVGTTAEIYEYLSGEGLDGFRLKAKARQRFKLLDTEQSSRWKARVQILPEVKLPDPLEGVKLQSLFRHRSSPSGHRRCRRMDAAVTRWPAFVYEQYNLHRLITGIKKELAGSLLQQQDLKDGERAPVKVVVPEDPTELSFWLAQNLPLKEEHRLLLLKLNSPVQRLRFELRALQLCRQVLCCHYCLNVVGSSKDIFCMSTEGPQGTYVNPGGHLHETITLYKVKGIFSVGSPSTDFSWFPGYAWSISKCKRCNQHMGWKFTTSNSHMKPVKFWGICRRSITIKMETIQESEQDNLLLVF